MRSGMPFLAGWGTFLMGIAALGLLGFGLDALPTVLLASAGAACVLAGVAAAGVERRDPHERAGGREEVLARASLAITGLTIGLMCVLVGVGVIGSGLTWAGVGLTLLGAAGALREWRAGRRPRRGGEGRGA